MDGMQKSKGKSVCIDLDDKSLLKNEFNCHQATDDDVHIDLTEETGLEYTFGIILRLIEMNNLNLFKVMLYRKPSSVNWTKTYMN